MKTLLRWIGGALRALVLALAAVVIAIEEWGWRPLVAWASRLAQLPPVARLEARVRAAAPTTALVLFLVPAVLLFPIKVLALWLIHLDHGTLGVVVIVAAKALGTALVGRLFILTEPKLVQFAWFARALAWWRATKLRVHDALRRSAWWHTLQRTRRWVALWLRRHLRGAR